MEDPECKHGNAKAICGRCEMDSQPSSEGWEKEFREGMASILGKSGKFAMNDMVLLVKNILSSSTQKAYEEGYNDGLELILYEIEKKRHTARDCADDGCGVNQTISEVRQIILKKMK